MQQWAGLKIHWDASCDRLRPIPHRRVADLTAREEESPPFMGGFRVSLKYLNEKRRCGLGSKFIGTLPTIFLAPALSHTVADLTAQGEESSPSVSGLTQKYKL